MKWIKKCGWLLACALVAVLSIILQVAASAAMVFFYVFFHNGSATQAELTMQAGEWLLDNTISILFAYQVAALFVFGIWYYAAYGRKKRAYDVEEPGTGQIAIIVVMGVLLQIAVSGILSIISYISPDVMADYQNMLEDAGIGEVSVFVMLATVILAPIGEELLCRGIIFRLAKHVSTRFWVANVIQALAFGVIHANLVQGIYAFAFGLILGYLYGKYEHIWVCMLLHGVINFSAAGVDLFWGIFLGIFPDGIPFVILVVVSIIVMVGIGLCLGALGPIEIRKRGGEPWAFM